MLEACVSVLAGYERRRLVTARLSLSNNNSLVCMYVIYSKRFFFVVGVRIDTICDLFMIIT